MFVILRFIVGYKSTAKSSIIFGRRKIDNPSIHGKWTKPISKLRDVGIIFIVQLMRTATLDIWLRKKRDTQAAYAFLKRLHKQFGEPKAIVTDKAPSLGSAFRKLQSVGLYTKTEHRTVKYLNNLIEQDHRPIKRRNKFYQSLRTASSTIKGMETIREYIKRTEEMERSSAFRCLLKSRY